MIRYEEDFKQMIVELNQTGRSIRGLSKNMVHLKQRFINGKIYMCQISPQD